MAAASKPEPILSTIQLMSAVLCADCEVISDSPGDVCSVCGSRSLLNLGRVLGGCIEAEERAVLLPEQDGDARRMFTVLVNREASTTLRPSRRWIRTERLGKSGS
jgi:hypothetical protein